MGYATLSPAMPDRGWKTIVLVISVTTSVTTFSLSAIVVSLSDYRPSRQGPQVYVPPYSCMIEGAPHTFTIAYENDKIQALRCGQSAALIHDKRSRYAEWYTPYPLCGDKPCVRIAGLPTAIPKSLCPQFTDVGFSRSQFTYWPCPSGKPNAVDGMYKHLGGVLFKKGIYLGAIHIWQDEYLSNVRDFELAARIGDAYLKIKDLTRANGYLSQSIEFGGDAPDSLLLAQAYLDRASIELQTNQAGKARDDAMAAAQHSTNSNLRNQSLEQFLKTKSMLGDKDVPALRKYLPNRDARESPPTQAQLQPKPKR